MINLVKQLRAQRFFSCPLFFAMVVGPTALLIALSFWLGFVPFLFNLDLVVAYVIAIVLARHLSWIAVTYLAVALVTLICVVPILRGLGMVYIADPILIGDYLKFWRFWPWRAIAAPMFAVSLFIAGLIFLIRNCKPSTVAMRPAIFLIILIQAVDVVCGSSHFGQGFLSAGVNISTSSAYQVFAMVRQFALTPRFVVLARLDDAVVNQAMVAHQPRILSIAVESWGHMKNDAMNSRIVSGLHDLVSEKYDFQRSIHPFVGGTISGELRELCGVLSRGVPAGIELKSLATHCLPTKLMAMGYATLGVHGNHSAFYSRYSLYPALGFQDTLFQAEFMRTDFGSCPGSMFSGPCDRQVIQTAVAFLKAHDRAFAHVMTLDTHLPLQPRSFGDRDCSDLAPLTEPNLCVYVHRFSDALRAIGELVQSGDLDKVFIFGDHAPPYAEGRIRKSFDSEHVPMVVLTRKSDRFVAK